jgi:hypothetical protein
MIRIKSSISQTGSMHLVVPLIVFMALFVVVGWRALSVYTHAAASPGVSIASSTLAPVRFGLYQASNNLQYSIGTSAQQKFAIAYYGWGETMQAASVQAAESAGIEPFLELQSCTGGGCSATTAVPMNSIINGSYDSYLTAFGSAVKAAGKPMFLTFDHEMNGGTGSNCGWYPWNQCYNNASTGVTPLQWIQAWNHVTAEVNSTAGGDACWIWAPNVQIGGSAVGNYWTSGNTTVKNVCRVGLDAYYANTNDTWANTIQPSYKAVEAASGSRYPFILTETGVADTDSNAVSQIDNLIAGARSVGDVPVMYFDKYNWTFTSAMQSEFLKDVK